MEKYLDQIIQLVGVHGFFAMLATIMTVRFISLGWYLEKRDMILSMVISSSIIGSLCVYYFTDFTDLKHLSGGAFMTIFGTPMLYHFLKFVTALAYEKTKLKTFAAIYFFLTPKPIKVVKKQGDKKIVEYEPPHAELTQMMDWARMDKPKVEPDEHEQDTGQDITPTPDATRVMSPSEIADITGSHDIEK